MKIKILKGGKKQDSPNHDLGDQEGNENTKKYEIEKIENILLYLPRLGNLGKVIIVVSNSSLYPPLRSTVLHTQGMPPDLVTQLKSETHH